MNEAAVGELDFDISTGRDPGVRPRKNRIGYERSNLLLVGGEAVTTFFWGGTNGSHELKDNVRHVVWQGHALRGRGFDVGSIVLGQRTTRLMELLDVGVVLQHSRRWG